MGKIVTVFGHFCLMLLGLVVMTVGCVLMKFLKWVFGTPQCGDSHPPSWDSSPMDTLPTHMMDQPIDDGVEYFLICRKPQQQVYRLGQFSDLGPIDASVN